MTEPDSLPDSEELFRLDLEPKLPYLLAPSVVDGVLRDFMAKAMELRGKYLQDESIDVAGKIDTMCQQLQAIFYGKESAYRSSPSWNRPEQLGRYLCETLEMGGNPEDAVRRLGQRIVAELMDAYLPYEADEMTDEQFTASVDFIAEMYAHALCGIPYEVD